MSLLAPALLAGLIALGVPVLAHLLGREPPRKVPFAALRFLQATDPPVRRRRRVHDPLLLAVRLMLLALLILVIARPVGLGEGDVRVIGEAHDAMIVVDASASARLRVDEVDGVERLRARVQEVVDALPPGSRVGLRTTDPSGPSAELGSSAAAIDDALETWANAEPRAGGWTMAGSVAEAANDLRRDAGSRPMAIYAVGDTTPGGLAGLPPAVGEVAIVPIPAAPPEAELPEHVALVNATWESAPDLDPLAVRVQVEVQRYGGEAASVRPVECALDIDGVEVGRALAQLQPDGSERLEFTHRLESSDPVRATLRLANVDDDPLSLDDRRHLWLMARERLDVVVVNGDPSERRANDEAFFLATALQSDDAGSSREVRGLAPDQLEGRVLEQGADALAQIDVLVLANVAAPSDLAAAAIQTRVNEGMGLWITAGDRIAPVDYNGRMNALLPLELRGASFAGTEVGRAEARAEGLAPATTSHPIFATLDGPLSLEAARTERMLLLEPDPRREAQTAMTYANGAPALVSREVGRGRVALLTTTIDRDWSDLALRPGFVRLVARTIGWLAGDGGGGTSTRIDVGEARALPGPGPYTVVDPAGTKHAVVGDAENPARFEATDVPGHYGVSTTEDAAELIHFVVQVPPSESDTTPRTIAAAAADDATDAAQIFEPRWRELLWVVLLLLAVEAALRLRRRRADARSGTS